MQNIIPNVQITSIGLKYKQKWEEKKCEIECQYAKTTTATCASHSWILDSWIEGIQGYLFRLLPVAHKQQIK